MIVHENFIRAKHPVKVHVWAGISVRGTTEICIFDETMDADLYCEIIQETLLPFLPSTYPEQHRFMQDNDPKHSFRNLKSTGGRRQQCLLT